MSGVTLFRHIHSHVERLSFILMVFDGYLTACGARAYQKRAVSKDSTWASCHGPASAEGVRSVGWMEVQTAWM